MSDQKNTVIIGRRHMVVRSWCDSLHIPVGDDVGVFIRPVGSAICGLSIHRVIFMGWMPGDGDTVIEREQGLDWYYTSVKTKFPPEGADMVSVPEVRFWGVQ